MTQMDLDNFADEHGTTDDIRDDVVLDPPEDGHLRRVNEIHDYWRGLERLGDGYYNAQSMVPPGEFSIVVDVDAVERGWGSDEPLEPGVWLSGKADVGTLKPPTPVNIDDRYLRFAAEACVIAARELVDDRVVALSTSLHETLTVKVPNEEPGYQEYLLGEGVHGGIPPEDGAETKHGFFSVRKMGTPAKIYTHAEVPRLTFDDLRVDVPEWWSQ